MKAAAWRGSTVASVSLSLLRELGAYLVDIHGQTEHLSLLNVHQHIRLLDRYANSGAAAGSLSRNLPSTACPAP